MALSKRYNPRTSEPEILDFWRDNEIYHFDPESDRPVYSIDTPPATVSGNLHLGHVYSYSHADIMARFWRMQGYNVYYPMGYDDNGLPTERLIERTEGIKPADIGREAFIKKCLEISAKYGTDYEVLWRRIGLSCDWRYSYRTINEHSRRIAQQSFIDLYKKGLAYRTKSPAIWNPVMQTAIAQAELADIERDTLFVNLKFMLDDGSILPIATTRPELLPACVAVFVHPDDPRYQTHIGQMAKTPLFDNFVPIIADKKADPEKGSGAVMCCTFGDVTDLAWWHEYDLPLIEVLNPDGTLNEKAGQYTGLTTVQARKQVIHDLHEGDYILSEETIHQTVRVHERDDTPVEYIMVPQWFIKVLDFREKFLQIGEELVWHPPQMKNIYTAWVENLSWDWCISRQRFFGVPFPLWHCAICGEVVLADSEQLPIDPHEATPPVDKCPACGNSSFVPETDVMDTWATSSMSPQIASHWLKNDALYQQVFPMTLRPQAYEIIRTWAFYTIVKSYHHFGEIPWKELGISGWGLLPEGKGKISKSRKNNAASPNEMIEQYSADAVRYWASSTGFGRNTIISEEKIQAGDKLVTKLWNVARFCQRFIADYELQDHVALSPADRWLLSRLNRLIQRSTQLFESYEYGTAKNEIERFFWTDLADNYLEMVKKRLYEGDEVSSEGAIYTLYYAMLTMTKLLAPFLPFITERIYRGLFAKDGTGSVHKSQWPIYDRTLISEQAESIGECLLTIASQVRKYKTDHSLSLGMEIAHLQITIKDETIRTALVDNTADIQSITRAIVVEIVESLSDDLVIISDSPDYIIAVQVE